jgi:hypothetical protein
LAIAFLHIGKNNVIYDNCLINRRRRPQETLK